MVQCVVVDFGGFWKLAVRIYLIKCGPFFVHSLVNGLVVLQTTFQTLHSNKVSLSSLFIPTILRQNSPSPLFFSMQYNYILTFNPNILFLYVNYNGILCSGLQLLLRLNYNDIIASLKQCFLTLCSFL